MMGRFLYGILIRLHPRSFRQRFGEEMMDTFDEATGRQSPAVLLLDGMLSLFRQWALRPAYRPPLPAPLREHVSGGPVFHFVEGSFPRPAAFVNGAILSLMAFAALAFTVSRGATFPSLVIGARYPRPHVLPVDRSSVGETELTTEVKVEVPVADPLAQLADLYFGIIRVLDAQDTDHDRTLSSPEITVAHIALRKVDQDHDGRLSAEECGFSLGDTHGRSIPREIAERARLAFMGGNPALAALDSDRDGEISATEIEKAAITLKTLDQNRDGILTPLELIPAPLESREP